MFDPKPVYDVTPDAILLKDFFDYKEEFVVRPPYQRKSVWPKKKQQQLLDSLLRRYYVPRIVIREVRLTKDKTLKEVIDGQQRITTAQLFFGNELALPESLSDVSSDIAGKTYNELSVEHRKYVDRGLKYSADIVKGIEDPKNSEHQRIAADIFWRLQQGEELTFMEKAHARLSSLSRNFVVKYADDITFDYAKYKPVDNNPHKHKYFNIIDRKNDRMQHLALMTRFLILEENNGPADIQDSQVIDYIEKYQKPDGIDNEQFENAAPAKAVLANLNTFAEIFANDPMLGDDIDEANSIKELRIEYFIVSAYLLLRHLKKYYVFSDKEKQLFNQFIIELHSRWKEKNENDRDMTLFSDNRQQSAAEIETRHRITRQLFFEHAEKSNHSMLSLDSKRSFNEAERIAIYRHDNGLCQQCLAQGKPEQEARVSWSDYEADHILAHIKGGRSEPINAQVLCGYHNKKKSDK